MLDLSALEEKPIPVGAEAQPTGKPLELPLDDIEEDENQPRKEFSEEKMQEMEDSIKLRGVRQPVSVRPHPDKPGKWILNFGARRYRGSKRAGKTTIPAFVDETSDDFDQVIENENRDNLKPMELALFIKGKLDQGVKKAEIARRLTRPASTITELLALIEAPACIEEAYRSGRCTSPKTLYELRALHDKFAEQVEAWCETAEEITRKGVADLGDQLKGKKKPPQDNDKGGSEGGQNAGAGNGASTGGPESLSHDEGNRGGGGSLDAGDGAGREPRTDGEQGTGSADTKGDSPKGNGKAEGEDGHDNIDRGELTSWPRGKAVSDPDSMKKPLLIVEHEGRAAAVLLNRRPSTAGLIRIRYEDGGGDAEVDAGTLKINLLTEAEK
ncbi:ParB/RepB/Spo0J family partition protein [Pseudomonas aeruginosa]|uniref:ParB/RepB/Spo0J family partition protein n=1 Tax=Pseudomonas aeruginosa TaxID=287 RepID=UPI003CC531A3